MNDLIYHLRSNAPISREHYMHRAADLIEQLEFKVQRLGAERLCTVQQLTEAKKLIEQLWQIIDDIDTYGDMAKSDDKAFRALVERRQKDRWKTGITTDGYILNLDEALAAAKQFRERNV